jgi:hypothetical protein
MRTMKTNGVKTMKTSELKDLALDWAVTAIENPDALKYGVEDWRSRRRHDVKAGEFLFRWSSSWAQGGPIIEREVISLIHPKYDCWTAHVYDKHIDDESYTLDGPTPLIAAMRCYVASKLGDEVDVPEGLR